ncbi:MAG: YitT family protein [Oscillospiraceae bacterium]|nr:YitT family protein [Oscillospiraceae bacterium]
MKSRDYITELKGISIKNLFCLLISGLVNAFGVTIFIAPVKLYDSGISGTSILLSQITPENFTLSLFLLILNIPLFLFGLRKQGALFTVYAIFAVACYSMGAWLITDVLPFDVSMASPLAGTDLLLCALFGGLISGIGSGMAIRFGGAMDGIEVLAVIFAKRLGMTVGTFVMIYNVALYIVCGFVINSWILPLYSIVTYAAALKTVDFIVEGLDRAKAALIVTSSPDEVCQALSKEFECGITTINARGYYSGSEKTIVYIIVNRFQIGRMNAIIRSRDPKAYVSIIEVADVLAAGTKK